ncbi:MAG: acyltransferase [Rikenellaceae bacterium]|nr:acyltransferase [Rikenellaceae bacterium]MBR2628466.1 acyltransferase [Alistipes sp.]
MEKKKLSTTYKILRALGFNYSEEEYGQVSLWRVVKQAFGNMYRKHLSKKMDWAILEPINPRKNRPRILRKLGCKVGKDVFIGDNVKIDLNHAELITIDDHAHIASGVRLLCHQRDMSDYCVGDDYAKLGYVIKPIHLCKGSLVGMESFIMPGVTIGEGAIVGAGSLVTKDVPAWTVATGRPAKVVKQIPQREV